MKITKIFGSAAVATLLSVGFLSCSEDEYISEMERSQVVSVGGLSFRIGAYPSDYSDGLRTVSGTTSNGKMSWVEGDKVSLLLTYDNAQTGVGETAEVTLQYDGERWTTTKGFSLGTTISGLPCYISAFYGPSATAVVSEDGKRYLPQTKGTDECFLFNDSSSVRATGEVEINFERKYSRIRVYVGTEGVPVTLRGAFKANGFNLVDSVRILSDVVGSAYFYGSWDEDANISVNGKVLNIEAASLDGHSYAVNMVPSADVNLSTITLVPGATISSEDVFVAIENGIEGNTCQLTVLGEVSDDQFSDLTNEIVLYFDVRTEGDEEYDPDFTLDLSDLVLSDGLLRNGTDFSYVKKLYLPRVISRIKKKAVDASDMTDVYAYANYEIDPGGTKKTNAFINTADCTLHLPTSFAEEVEGADGLWFNTTWLEILADIDE